MIASHVSGGRAGEGTKLGSCSASEILPQCSASLAHWSNLHLPPGQNERPAQGEILSLGSCQIS